jgi:NADPH:quinone reductase
MPRHVSVPGGPPVHAFEGRIVLAGFASGAAATTALDRVLVRNYSILGLHLGRYREHLPGALREAHLELTALADTGIVAPLVGGRLRLDEAPDGLTRLAAGETVGRLVVLP